MAKRKELDMSPKGCAERALAGQCQTLHPHSGLPVEDARAKALEIAQVFPGQLQVQEERFEFEGTTHVSFLVMPVKFKSAEQRMKDINPGSRSKVTYIQVL